ncbi:MAG: ATP synthase F1 subunit gamma [Myxococcota bacterium]|jgi:F-type H+-transporting ATPase subunit gamma|nr:ATP synthase F1 subunit gamma [Myxococcota bacterium]
MPSLKAIRARINSVRNTEKLTKAMKMVSASKLRRAQMAVLASRPYASKLLEVIDHLTLRVAKDAHPLLRESENPRRALLLLITSDRGLCGAFNANINKRALAFIQERGAQYEQLEVEVVGRKGYEFLKRRGVEIGWYDPEAWSSGLAMLSQKRAELYAKRFADGELDEVFVLFTRFRSAVAQEVVLDRVLPLRETDAPAPGSELAAVEYVYEPEPSMLLDELLPRAVSVQILRGFRESAASEHGARMTAMDNASNNATEMIAQLTLQYNRARQAAITRELIEIISGAEAL